MNYIDMKKIEIIMRDKGISFEELAARMGVTEEELQNWFSLSNHTDFDVRCYFGLSKALEIHVKELFLKDI